MSDLRLLERVREWQHTPGLRARNHAGTRVTSVVKHLQLLLNSRVGTTLMDGQFGLPDLSDLKLTYPDSVQDMEKTISQTIETYEPRLTRVGVNFVFQDDRTLSLFFRIEATLITGVKNEEIILESSVDAFGKMTVRT
ncbi:type VI secretion system baseplate subunit TssE [Desulfoluna sp.]|uniref:type VI secretion system baseplate subunit TssE n=1 Tax=Desulfoluna sp. TaxID=2045199 RepID=UPI00261B6A93|nr:type VI secretion system baseplate subunit TssE [Desulfoluna sp.]